MSSYEIINQAKDNCIDLCMMNYGKTPKINIICKKDYSFVYIPSHIHYIVLELLKNSTRATIENTTNNDQIITVMVSEGEDDLIIKISDWGKGFSRTKLSEIFKYSYTTANSNYIFKSNSLENRLNINVNYKSPFAGFGHGLPLSRLYAKYFGGELQLIPFEGVGTDAFVYINKLGDSSEVVP